MTTASIKNYSNLLYDALKQYPIVDLAPVFDRGVRGRTMSGRGSNWLLDKVYEAGVKTIIDRNHPKQADFYMAEKKKSQGIILAISCSNKATSV